MMVDDIGPPVKDTPFLPSERQTHLLVRAVGVRGIGRQEPRIGRGYCAQWVRA